MQPKIAIIGAGPGGCTLARLLHNAQVPCTVFESETSIDYRSQGGTLDLRDRTGLLAVKEAGLWDEFLKYARYDGEYLLVCDKDRTTWMKRNQGKVEGKQALSFSAPEIDRADLRRLLLESVPKEMIQWGRKLKSVDEDLTLHFADGHVEKGYDLVVGADGAWSKVRNLLSDEKPFYSGIGGYHVTISDAKRRAPRAYEFVNRGSVFAVNPGKHLAGQQLGDRSINVGFYSVRDEDWIKDAPGDIPTVKADILKQIAHWHEDLRNLVDFADSRAEKRNLYMLPVGYRWKHKPGVTLIGDAAHLQTPFAGIGVNMAMHDALELSRAIIKASKSNDADALDSCIASYEEEAFVRAKKGMELTYGSMMDKFFTPGAPRTSMHSWVTRFAKEEMPPFFHPFLTAFVYIGYSFYSLWLEVVRAVSPL